MREAAYGFAERGHDVEVLTTCALDHFSWANELPAGESVEKGLTVRRFPTVRHPSRAALAAQLSVQSGRVPDLDHQVSWLGFQFSVPGLFEHVLRHGDGYDAIVFSPYLYWTTSACVPFVPERAVVMACLHDETYARLEILRPVLAGPALVWFLSEPERELAHRLGPVTRRHAVTGAGVAVPSSYDPEGFRARYGLVRPFVLYAGRKEEGKGLPFLLDALADAVSTHDLGFDLVVIGRGEMAVPKPLRGRVTDLGYLPDEQRNDAFAAAAAYVQPSRNESFSRTVMEAWLAGTPVVGFSGSEVVAWHLARSGGGLAFSNAAELVRALGSLVQDPQRAAALAASGRRYVLEHYSWPAVLDRMEASLHEVFGRARPSRPQPAPLSPPSSAPPPPAQANRTLPVRRLVVGSYPPVPGEPAAATLAAVRRAWAEGREVVVASPRPSAAPVVARLAGPSAGRSLRRLTRAHTCQEVVFCLEPGMPFLARRRGARRTARRLAHALGSFSNVELVVTGELGVPGSVLAALWPVARTVIASSEAIAKELKSSGAPAVRVVEARSAGSPVSVLASEARSAKGSVGVLLHGSVGAFEPGDLLLRRRFLRLLGAISRKVLGRRAPAFRARLRRLASRL